MHLLVLLPRPVEAALLLFPIHPEYEERRRSEDAVIESENNPLAKVNSLWIKQTVSRAHSLHIWPLEVEYMLLRFQTHAGRWDCFMLC